MMTRVVALMCAVVVSGGLGTERRLEPVSIYVDAGGTNLGDYALTVNGAAVPILKVVAGPHAVSAIGLFDASTSITVSPLSDAARRLAGVANTADTLRVATFAERILISPTIIRDNATAGRAAREASQRGGPSPLWDAMYDSVEAVARAPGARVVLAYTDGRASGNDRSHREVFDRATELGVTVFIVGVSDLAFRNTSQVLVVGRNEAARRIAGATGGELFELLKLSDTPTHYLVSALSDFRRRTRIDFAPPVRAPGAQELVVTHKGQTVRAPQRVPSG